MEKKTVLILANSDSGLYDFRKELLLALQEAGYAVHISVPDTGYLHKIRGLGCVCHETVMERRGMNPLKDMKLFGFYLRLIKQTQAAVVLTYTIKPNIYGNLACRFRKVPGIANITGLGTALEKPGTLQKILVQMYRAALKKTSCIFFQNRRNLDFMRETGCIGYDAPVRLIAGSGVNLQEHPYCSYPVKKDKTIFLSVMRIMESKGIAELLQTMETIHREAPDTVFQLLGAYEEESRSLYEPKIRDLQEQGILEYYGYRDDVPVFLENCHAILHPSYSEGMSNVLLEAAAMGRPLLASDISGCREIVLNGITGMLFAPKDAGALTAAVRNFLAIDPVEWERMGKEARLHVEAHFDRKEVVAAYLEAIEETQAGKSF